MIQALIGKKIEQTQKFLENGRRIPVTEISVADNTVLQVKTIEKDTYAAAQLGIGAKKKPGITAKGHSRKAGLSIVSEFVREVSLDGVSEADMPKAGDMITVDAVFKPGDVVQVIGTSKGKGFAGVVKRHHFRGGPKTHGQSDRERAPGSIGQTTTPGRVYKGKKMAGRMGSETVTIKNLTVVDVDAVNKKLLVSGLVPGHRNALVFVERIGEVKKFVPLLKTPLRPEGSAGQDEAVTENAVEETPVSVEAVLPTDEAPATVVEAVAAVEEKKEEAQVEVKQEEPVGEEGEKKE